MKTRMIYRTVSGTAVALALAAVGACSEAPTPLAPGATGSHEAYLQGDPGMGPDIADVRAATEQFHDVNAAIAAGYTNPAGRRCEQTAAGGMGIHSPNASLMATQEIDPLRPEILLYLPKSDGGYRLIGVEYVQWVIVSDPAGSFVGPWRLATRWPSNYIASPVPELFGQAFSEPMAGHAAGGPWHTELHAWIWQANLTGMFEPYNPSISCG